MLQSPLAHSQAPITRDQLCATRRQILQGTAGGLLALATGSSFHLGADVAQAQSTSDLAPLQRFPRMMQNYYVEKVRELVRNNRKRRAELSSREEAEAYLEDIRAKIHASFGPWPEKTPLKPRVVGRVERPEYIIEKVIFESRPQFFVTANLYLPKSISEPRPGVVGSCGHSTNGKAADAYQAFAQGLARLGFVCLIFDPIGQGERLQYLNEQGASRYGAGVREHLQGGNQQFLVDEFFGTWRAWDGIRALDYLLTREEVDPRHVGITGNSGGGTMTTWLCGVESRWTMAAPSCFVTTFLRNLENELPADTEQCPPRALALGLDHLDFLAAMAPKPVILLAQERDYFDARGTEEAYAELRRLYKLLGAEDQVGLFIGPRTHGYSQENREAMYGWFQLASGMEVAPQEPELRIEPDEVLWCTESGQVQELDSRPIYSFTRDRSQELASARNEKAEERDALSDRVSRVLRLESLPPFGPEANVPEYRILRPRGSRRYPKPHAGSYAVETERQLFSLVYRLADEPVYSRPPRGIPQAILYVSHVSSDSELRSEGWLRELVESERDVPFYSCDVRGIGESMPDTCNANSFFTPYGCDYFYAIHGIMLDLPYLGQKTYDLLRVLDWLASHGHEQVHLVAKGWGALPATFASLLSPLVNRVTLRNALTSYAELAETADYDWPLATLLPGVLSEFDLPECYAALEEKQLRSMDPWDARPRTDR
jgi:dienelactone hydrolase